METIRSYMGKYRELIMYGIFGVLTTGVNFSAYFLLCSAFPDTHAYKQIANMLAWVVSVLFAYLTSRSYVFENRAGTPRGVLVEVSSFVSARLFTFGVEIAMMYAGIVLLAINHILVKVFAGVWVIILNYVLSKLIVFRKKKR